MWLYLALGSAFLLGIYDVAKKKAVGRNSVLSVLLVATAVSTLLLAPFLFIYPGNLDSHLALALKGAIVTSAWVSGMVGLKYLPITTASMIKASRPFFVVLLSIILFGEQLNPWQWSGVALALLSLTLLSVGGKKSDGGEKSTRGLVAMAISVLAGVVSALYDKHIMSGLQLEPMMVQSWSNFYITVFLLVCILVRRLVAGPDSQAFRWDWTLVLIALLITGADALYFFALRQDGALLSVISLIRRCAVIVTFSIGAIFFKEKHLKAKVVDMLILVLGMLCLLMGSR